MSYMDRPAEWRKMYGRIISINPTKARSFRCGGFAVYADSHPIEIIQENAQVDRILGGLRSGELVDVTETHQKGLRIAGTGHSQAKMENTGKKVFITVDKNGGIALKAADTPEDIAACEAQIKRTGIIVPDEYKIADPRMFEGRVTPGTESLLLHNLTEKIEDINTKVFGNSPSIKPGPHKVT